MSKYSPWNLTRDMVMFGEWNYWLCRRADLTAHLWPTARLDLYEAGLTIDEAMQRTYPEWKAPND